jgi:hypothetical protein
MLTAGLLVTFVFAGCEESNDRSGGGASPAPFATSRDDHEQEPADAPDRADHESKTGAQGRADHGGDVVELGTTTVGDFSIRASRDKGPIKPGGDAAIDVWVDGGVGKGVSAVRIWIGTQNAKGSIKAKAEIEDGKWHTHAEVPDPMPSGSKLWVEIEHNAGEKSTASFDLNA